MVNLDVTQWFSFFCPQMVDRLCVQVQDAVNALKVGNSAASQDDLGQAEKVIRDADNSKQVRIMTGVHALFMESD